ncbi:MAG TPA: MCE family protein [Pseudonocardiaceae bacterium]|jgi:virulence factor Mce-like protein|nr:MCE family protein [Pseudonocardiaceae bacterium]
MTFQSRFTKDLARGVALACVLALIAAAVVWFIFVNGNSRKITAYFSQGIGISANSDVRVLGVKVGSVDSVDPEGTLVRVVMSVDRNIKIPAGADAVVVAPSVVSDRYVQFAPVYTGGPTIADNAVIPASRTATPVELDQLYNSLNKLAVDLGPNGVNANGALSNLLNSTAANLNGNGQNLHDTITQLAGLASTLEQNQGDLFSTVDNLAKFTTTLAQNDAQVQQFNQSLSNVTGFLASEKGNLAQAVNQLGISLGQVQGFISDNRAALKSNVDNLAGVTKVLVDERSSLAEVLDVAPLTLSNVVNAYNAAGGTLDARADINELTNPPIVEVCKLLRQLTPSSLPQTLAGICDQLAPVINGLVPLPSPASVLSNLQNGKLPTLPLPLATTLYGTPSGGGQ